MKYGFASSPSALVTKGGWKQERVAQCCGATIYPRSVKTAGKNENTSQNVQWWFTTWIHMVDVFKKNCLKQMQVISYFYHGSSTSPTLTYPSQTK